MELKYIMDEYGNFALFSPGTNAHSAIARGFHFKTVSAGFCRIKHSTDTEFKVSVECFGESISTGLKSREEDSKIITDKLNNNY